MSIISREVIKGLAGGVGFLVAVVLMDMPLWLAGVIGAGLYAGASLLLPRTPASDESWAALGVTVEGRDQFLDRCRKSAAELVPITTRLFRTKSGARVEDLSRIAGRLIAYFEKKPDAILLAHAVPQNLEHLAGMLRQYIELGDYQQPGQTIEEALLKVESTLDNACIAFEVMYQQLLNNDVAALRASAQTFDFLMGVEVEIEKERRRQLPPLPELNHRPAVPARPPQTERPL